jgi:hypothetical protein
LNGDVISLSVNPDAAATPALSAKELALFDALNFSPPTASPNKQSPSPSKDAKKYEAYTILPTPALSLFSTFPLAQEKGIAIQEMGLSPSTVGLFRKDGPRLLNLENITGAKVLEWLHSQRDNGLGMDFSRSKQPNGLESSSVEWLGRFWVWVANEGIDLSDDFTSASFQSLHLLPSKNGTLESLRNGLFGTYGLDTVVMEVLASLGTTFLHSKFSPLAPALEALKKNFPSAVRDPSEVHIILDRMSISPWVDVSLKEDQVKSLRDYLTRWVPEKCRLQALTEDQRWKLRALPVWPLLQASPQAVNARPRMESSSNRTSRFLPSFGLGGGKNQNVKGPTGPPVNAARSIGAVAPPTPEGEADSLTPAALCIPSSTQLPLPISPKTLFLDGTLLDIALLPHLLPTSPAAATDIEILTLALSNFAAQSTYLQGLYLEYMVQHRDTLPPRLLTLLDSAKFIPVADGTLQAPEWVIDSNPKSPLIALYPGNSDRIPKGTEEVAVVVRQLRTLGLLRDKLTAAIITERIGFISSSSQDESAAKLAVRLLDVLYTTGFDCSTIEFSPDAKWLPTNAGLLGHEQCLDADLIRPDLFDEVLPLLSSNVQISPSLRKAFSWDKPLPLSTLTLQLQNLILHPEGTPGIAKKLKSVIKELAVRELSDEDVKNIRLIVGDQKWIPISSTRVSDTAHAVFVLPVPLKGFCEIPSSITDREEVRAFLRKMGCSERLGSFRFHCIPF